MEPDVLLARPETARARYEAQGLEVRVTWIDERRPDRGPAAWRVVRVTRSGRAVELVAAAFPEAADGDVAEP